MHLMNGAFATGYEHFHIEILHIDFISIQVVLDWRPCKPNQGRYALTTRFA